MRRLFLTAVRLCAALAPAVGALDLAGLSWRQLRAFQRGAGCLSHCDEGHTYGPWCQMGWPVPGPSYLMNALAEATMPLPEPAQRLNDETIRAIHASLTQLAEAELTGPQRVRKKLREQGLASTGGDSPEWRYPPEPVDTEGDRPAGCEAAVCFGMECMTECASSHRLGRYAAEVRASTPGLA